ncbi:hypothetical protein Zm00014a_044434 [Zea mays]|uniref:Uncharacterized protein n=1 Tax=Zea mays TaxID=4577 RepID=A0A3L6FV78_MAIZE|nr:hypothetical protein Zm00014a_044434 [Zea mays]
MKMEVELRAVHEMRAELAQVRMDIQNLGAMRQELMGQVQGLTQDLAQSAEDLHKWLLRWRNFELRLVTRRRGHGPLCLQAIKASAATDSGSQYGTGAAHGSWGAYDLQRAPGRR